MKVLFAVSNEEISESIVKKYQKEYKQIISYKNVYYFNAILKELQKDKTYDRIVISEDLEAFTHTQYDQIDKFIFDKLDSISDEASNVKGNDTPIILICSDRRTKTESMLIKLFGIGVYDAIIGTDRSVDEVCKLINRPRTKKEAKAYYQIDTEDVGYQAENENDVSEMEIQNIVAHYKRLGKNEDRYLDSFNNIAAQYNDTQLRIITKFLPLNVRAVLEEKSSKYQQIMSFNNAISDALRKGKKEEEDEGPSEILLKSKNRDTVLSKPVVIPSAVNMGGMKKLAKRKPIEQQVIKEEPEEHKLDLTVKSEPVIPEPQKVEPTPPIIEGLDDFEDFVQEPIKPETVEPQTMIQLEETMKPEKIEPATVESNHLQEPIIEGLEELEPVIIQSEVGQQEIIPEAIQPVKRGRGRPRKKPLPTEELDKPKRGRGRPRKKPLPMQEVIEQPNEEMILPGLEMTPPEETEVETPKTNKVEAEENFLPGFSEFDTKEIQEPVKPSTNNQMFEMAPKETIQQPTFLPGVDEEELEKSVSPELERPEPKVEVKLEEPKSKEEKEDLFSGYTNVNTSVPINSYYQEKTEVATRNQQEDYEEIDLSYLLTAGKKIVTFTGTSKNGTSFIVSNIAELLSSIGVNVAILDTTKNRNFYYIYTKNEEQLREIATYSIKQLSQGIANGISVNKNLTVYTSLPDEEDGIYQVDKILEALLKKHSLILIDTDFDTPLGYFKQSQETYLIQSMDILTIQPLTAFLKELKVKNILDERKLRIVLNKVVKIRGIKPATIIGGMAFYNDPAMSFMTELFDRDRIKYVSIPFEEETYIKYLEGIIECEISQKGYSKVFMQTLRELGNMVYPIVTTTSKNHKNYQPPSNGESNFSSSMNNTLNKMKNF